MKTLYILFIFGFMGWAFYEQTQTSPNVFIQVIGVLVFFFGMMKLMAKVPSNSKEEEDKDV
jgi:spore maturation protein SpmA